jgi:PAS domain S-box-containing protein
MRELKYNDLNQVNYKNIAVKFVLALFVALFFSILIWIIFWDQNRDFVHAILELASACIGVATFLIIWSKRDNESNINDILGFGYLMVSIFDFIHTYYYENFIQNDALRGELSIKFWVIARLTEVVVLLIFSYSPYVKQANKHLKIISTFIITGLIIYLSYGFPGLIPGLYNGQGVTDVKVALEYFVILIAMLTLFNVKKNLNSENLINFKYLYISILLIIPSEICFTLFKDSGSFWVVFGHVIKVISYIYLYKAVFQSSINYPYDKLRDNNQKLSDILNTVPISVVTYDEDFKLEYANKKFEELFKYSKDEIIGLNDVEFLKLMRKVGNDSESTLAFRVNNGEENTKNIIRTYLDAEDNEIKILINAHKIKDGILVLINDAKQEQEIKNLNLQAQTILNAIAIPTMIIDYMENIVACNSFLAQLVEVEHEDIVGMKMNELNEITSFSDNEFAKIFQSSNFRNDERDCSIETPKGNKKHIKITTSVITNIYNEKIGLLIVVQDISKLKEEQLKLINQEKLALLGQMGATIIHETRNFLTTIKGNSQLIELNVDNEKVKRYARKINSDSNEVNRIISDFLNLSKPRETELEEVAFIDLILSMKDTIETSSLINKVQLVLELDYDERYILCDETQIKQVILNICKNAVDAMEETVNPVLHIATGLNEDDNEVFIKISDNGKGIDNETIKKIGTPFFTTKKTGTGLGINACYQIIREHKGRIDIDSELGKGTSFTIILPYIDEELEEIEELLNEI